MDGAVLRLLHNNHIALITQVGHALQQQRALYIIPALEYNTSAMSDVQGRALTVALAHGKAFYLHT